MYSLVILYQFGPHAKKTNEENFCKAICHQPLKIMQKSIGNNHSYYVLLSLCKPLELFEELKQYFSESGGDYLFISELSPDKCYRFGNSLMAERIEYILLDRKL